MLKLAYLIVSGMIAFGAHSVTAVDPATQTQERAAAVESSFVGSTLDSSAAPGGQDVTLIPSSPPPSSFHRGFTEKQSEQPCWNEHTKAHYSSDLIGKAETAYHLALVGANPRQVDILSAISHAESGSHLGCFGDDSDKYYGQPTNDGRHYGESYGLFQIRTIIEATEKGTGECRDMSRLKKGIDQQAQCAWEISGKGKDFTPWSVYTTDNPKRTYRRYLGADW